MNLKIISREQQIETFLYLFKPDLFPFLSPSLPFLKLPHTFIPSHSSPKQSRFPHRTSNSPGPLPATFSPSGLRTQSTKPLPSSTASPLLVSLIRFYSILFTSSHFPMCSTSLLRTRNRRVLSLLNSMI